VTIDLEELDLDEPRKRVAVIAAPVDSAPGADPGPQATGGSQLDPAQERTLNALEHLFPVRFERTCPSDLNQVDGVLALGPGSLAKIPAGLPRLALPSGATRSDSWRLDRRADATEAPGEPTPVVLSSEPRLARPLRGRSISESALAGELAHAAARGRVLASVEGRPVWRQLGDGAAPLGVSAYPLAGLHDGEVLRDHLRAGRFMGLLPLIHLLDQVLGAGGWRRPPLRASFVIDDPNLHWPSYGFLKYGELAAHAARHGYHVGLATVPLDGWLVDRRVTSLLARNASALSLLVHGNDHVARELGRLSTDAEALSAIAQALRRIAALEQRHGVTVERVMVPPYEDCSQAALRAMFRLGIEAACHTRPYPWRDPLHPPTPLAGWRPAELVAGGLPVLPRHPLDAPREDLALRALLGQPLILYGHHGDFAQGLDILAEAASEIDGLGDAQWGPLGWIARGSYATRRTGEVLLVRMHARRVAVEVPAGVRTLRIVVEEPLGGAAGHRLIHGGGSISLAFAAGLGVSEPLVVDAPARIDMTLIADRPLTPAQVPSRSTRPWPLIRRALVEGRDRIQALR
jgi:hypothetical protein